MLKIARISVILLTLGFSCNPNPWKEKSHEDWTMEETTLVLVKSPWVQHQTFSFFTRGRYIRQVRYIARLRSARPVRLALARLAQFQPGPNLRSVGPVDSERVEAVSRRLRFPDEIVVSLSAYPDNYHKRLEAERFQELKESCFLILETGEKRLPLRRFHPPDKVMTGEALFHFERPEVLSPSGKIRFVVELGSKQKIKLDLQFKLEELIFEGRLEV